MSLVEGLVLVHVAGAIVWAGGAVMLTLQAGRAAKDTTAMTAFAGWAEWVGTRVMMPAMLAIIVAGVWLVIDSDVYEFSSGFVSIGLTVFVVSFILGGAFYGPQTKKLNETIAADGPSSAAVGDVVRRILIVSRLELVAIAVVIWAMVTKPGV